MLGVGRSVVRDEENMGKYLEVWENVGVGVEKCVGVWVEVWVVWGSIGRCGKCVWGGKR